MTPEETGKPIWQPIETAPKNNMRVILYCPAKKFGRTVFEGHWGFNQYGFPSWVKTESGCQVRPSAWQPLPEAPQDETE
jgi:hypothetical protein